MSAKPALEFNEESDSSDEEGGAIQVGTAHQAILPSQVKLKAGDFYPPFAEGILLWKPNKTLAEEDLDSYIRDAKSVHNYTMEQSLGLLFWHKHNVSDSRKDLAHFTPCPDDWTIEDKVLFEQAFMFHGKNFHRIQQNLPDKAIGSMIKYYYHWKKLRTKASLIDIYARKNQRLQSDSQEGAPDDDGSSHDSTSAASIVVRCTNCRIIVPDKRYNGETRDQKLCKLCHQYLLKTGGMRTGATKRGLCEGILPTYYAVGGKGQQCKHLYLDHPQLIALASNREGSSEETLSSNIMAVRRVVQEKKQVLATALHEIEDGIDSMVPPEEGGRINPRWLTEEIPLALQGFRHFGADFSAVADIIGNKSEANVQAFYNQNKKKYDLDQLIAEYNAESTS